MIGTLALVYALVIAQQLLFIAIAYPLATGVGAGVPEVAIGSPPLFRVRRRSVTISFGPLPTASLTLRDAGPDELSLSRRLAIRLGPWPVLLAVATACIGPSAALHSFAVAFQQIVFVVDPRPLVRAFLELASVAPVHVTFGVLLTKLVAANLLPFAGLAGGAALTELVWREPPRWWLLASIVFMLVWLLGRFAWAVLSVIA